MLENGKERFIFTKSYEIAYAMFRIAGQIGDNEKDFSERLKSLGGSLLQAVAGEDYASARKVLQVAECLAKFSSDTGMITPANANILLGEVYTLDAAIIEHRNAATGDDLNLADIFSKQEPESEPKLKSEPEPKRAAAAEIRQSAIQENPATEDAATGNPATDITTNIIKAEIRQSAIMDKIRQSGNCRLKEIQDVLPGTSERTIRYDLQSLVEKNLIERVGHGGPSVFYRIPVSAG